MPTYDDQQPDPYDVKLNDEQRTCLALWLTRELQAGLDAKGSQDLEVDYWHSLYEQARTRTGANVPWPDAADLTSYIPTEKVDALVARIVRTVMAEPICTVEGWGQAAQNAPFVEEFHQWKAEEERLQGVFDRLVLISLIEPRGLLEISEGYELEPIQRKTIKAVVRTDPVTKGIVYGADGTPELMQKDDGSYVDALPDDTAAEVVVDEQGVKRTGPQYRVIPYRDSCILPGHARDKQQVWGYAKRCWKRLFELQAQSKGKDAIYDKASVDRLTSSEDVEQTPALQRSHMDVAPTQDHRSAEKELWEMLVKVDLSVIFDMHDVPAPKNAKGLRWYLCTVHLDQQLLLRVQYDDVDRCRFVPVILCPRPDRVTEGFSFIGHKLITITEEHTSWRNMAADRESMVTQSPVKRLTGALWDPIEQPWGPKAVIDVRAMNEIEPVVVPQQTAGAFTHIQMMERNAERVAGINDVASGQVAQESRTLGEVNMATEQSFVRMDLIVKRFQEAIEDIYQIRHAIWKRTLAENQSGVDVPDSLKVGLEGRGVPIEALPNGKFDAALLEGSYRFKPHGSVETADKAKQRATFVQAMQFLPQFLQGVQMLSATGGPQAGKVLMRMFLHLFQLGNMQAFLGTASAQPPMMPGMPPGMPGMPPGLALGPGAPLPPGMGQPGGMPGMPPGAPPIAPGPLGVQ